MKKNCPKEIKFYRVFARVFFYFEGLKKIVKESEQREKERESERPMQYSKKRKEREKETRDKMKCITENKNRYTTFIIK